MRQPPISGPVFTSPLKGRKRFTADLSELSAHPESIPRSGQWTVKRIKSGEEEASLEIAFTNLDEGKVQTIILVVPDSSLYPNEHAYFGYSQDAEGLESNVARVLDEMPTKLVGSTLRETVEFFVKAVSGVGDSESDDMDESDDYEEDTDFVMFDEDFDELSSRTPQLSLGHLKKDFVEVKAAGYNPGILRTGQNRIVLSVSLPVSDLFKLIAPHALLAWDRRFLEPGLYLTLLISGFHDMYPVLQRDGTLAPHLLCTGSVPKFKVGFTRQYKPSGDGAAAAFREFFSRVSYPEEMEETSDSTSGPDTCMVDLENDPDQGTFRKMSLSTSLESLLDQQLLRLLQLRRRFNLDWAGAEELLWQSETMQQDPATIFQQKRQELESAKLDEMKLSQSNNLPSDPIPTGDSEMNILMISFVFLLRRLALSTRHCVVCHRKLREHENLRPYVCNSGLCAFQYYSLNLGPSIEHEVISNTGAVDLLVSLAYVSAAEGVLDEPLPRGMGLRVRPPAMTHIEIDGDGLCEFDALDISHMRSAIVELLASLPPITAMKDYLQRQFTAGKMNVQLKNMDPNVLPAAWSVLRWCVASCTAHIQELTEPEDRLRNLGDYRQFRFLVGAPDKEKKFLDALPQGKHPAVFAFHGSPLRNWHSIIRHGLWFKQIVHGRSHGNGVYFCQDASVSLGSYAQPSSTVWRNSTIKPKTCCTLAEIVNRKKDFVFKNAPYFVVDKTDWIMCRYLLVRTMRTDEVGMAVDLPQPKKEPKVGEYLKQEKEFSTRIGGMSIDIPQPSYQLDKLVKASLLARKEVVLDAEDCTVFDGPKNEPSESRANPSPSEGTNGTVGIKHVLSRATRAWNPDDEWIQKNVTELLSPPTESSVTASVALKKEFKAMMREQNNALEANDLGTLGWYLPPQHNGDNLYQWLVELHSFDPELPVAKDMKSNGIPSVALEIRFPPSFPHAPPFFRVIRPRFRPFQQGGGGHVTIGGSICMDLLTSDGWLPSYCVSAVLLQIKLAISSTTPFPARLHRELDRSYTPEEALNGFIRAASLHNWKIKNEREVRRLVMAS